MLKSILNGYFVGSILSFIIMMIIAKFLFPEFSTFENIGYSLLIVIMVNTTNILNKLDQRSKEED